MRVIMNCWSRTPPLCRSIRLAKIASTVCVWHSARCVPEEERCLVCTPNRSWRSCYSSAWFWAPLFSLVLTDAVVATPEQDKCGHSAGVGCCPAVLASARNWCAVYLWTGNSLWACHRLPRCASPWSFSHFQRRSFRSLWSDKSVSPELLFLHFEQQMFVKHPLKCLRRDPAL